MSCRNKSQNSSKKGLIIQPRNASLPSARLRMQIEHISGKRAFAPDESLSKVIRTNVQIKTERDGQEHTTQIAFNNIVM